MSIPAFHLRIRLRLILLSSLSLLPFSSALAVQKPPDPTPFIELNQTRQRLAGIRIQTVQRRSFTPRTPVPARVVDPLPLLEIANRLEQLAAELSAAEPAADIARKRLSRLNKAGQAIRQERLEQVRQEWLAARTRADTLRLESHRLQNRLTAEWGPVLSGWITSGDDTMQDLVHRRVYLLLLTLPDEDASPTAVLGNMDTLLPLQYVSPAPRTDATLSDPTHFFVASEPAELRVGQRLTAWLTETGEAVPVPAEAVVWYGGLPWVFVRKDISRFERRRLNKWRDAGPRWWIQSGLEGGEQVVTRGAQLLLSEEFRSQVPEEDDD